MGADPPPQGVKVARRNTGKDAPNLSPAVIALLTASWTDEYVRWQGRDLSARCYVAYSDEAGRDSEAKPATGPI